VTDHHHHSEREATNTVYRIRVTVQKSAVARAYLRRADVRPQRVPRRSTRLWLAYARPPPNNNNNNNKYGARVSLSRRRRRRRRCRFVRPPGSSFFFRRQRRGRRSSRRAVRASAVIKKPRVAFGLISVRTYSTRRTRVGRRVFHERAVFIGVVTRTPGRGRNISAARPAIRPKWNVRDNRRLSTDFQPTKPSRSDTAGPARSQ